jgi:hypothetical protein
VVSNNLALTHIAASLALMLKKVVKVVKSGDILQFIFLYLLKIISCFFENPL